MGKFVELTLKQGSASTAKRDVERMCKKLLANPVIETYRVEVAQGSGLGAQGRSFKRRAKRA